MYTYTCHIYTQCGEWNVSFGFGIGVWGIGVSAAGAWGPGGWFTVYTLVNQGLEKIKLEVNYSHQGCAAGKRIEYSEELACVPAHNRKPVYACRASWLVFCVCVCLCLASFFSFNCLLSYYCCTRGTLWYLQKFLQYIIVEFTPSIISMANLCKQRSNGGPQWSAMLPPLPCSHPNIS
jgi:hypothetical protein